MTVMMAPAGYAGLGISGRMWPAHGRLPAILLWMHNGLGYIYRQSGLTG
jgi:hypothetical protein